MLSEIIHSTGTLFGNNRPETESCKKHMPEWKLFVESEGKWQTDRSPVFFRLMSFNGIDYAVVFILVKIGNFIL